MTENPNPGGFNRLACVIYPSSAGSTGFPIQKSCITGEVDLKHLRRHLKRIHECHSGQCAKPCEIVAHCLSDKIKDIVKIRKRRGGTVAETWIRMFEQAYPHHENIPAPYLPCPGQLLALTQHPTEEFMNVLGSAFANNQTVGMDLPAHENVHTFFRWYHIFYDVVSRTGPLPGAETELQAVATMHQPGSVLSPGHQEGLQLSTPTRDSSNSDAATPVTQPDFIQNPSATAGMSECTCYGQHFCMQCFDTEWERYSAS